MTTLTTQQHHQVAVSKNQLEQERLKLREELNDAIKKHTLQGNSLNQYKEECNRLNGEVSRLQRDTEQSRTDLRAAEEQVGALREDNHQLRQLKAHQDTEIDRLNTGLIEERKSKYTT